MNSPHPDQPSNPSMNQAEQTLRLLASLPAPDGLSHRVQAQLRSAPRSTSLLNWRPLNGWMFSPALRGAAAAVIVCIVAGGGWQIYSHVQPAPTAQNHNTVLPARIGGNGGFSSAGAIARPDTLNGPVVVQPAPKAEATVAHPAVKPAPATVRPATPQKGKKKTVPQNAPAVR